MEWYTQIIIFLAAAVILAILLLCYLVCIIEDLKLKLAKSNLELNYKKDNTNKRR